MKFKIKARKKQSSLNMILISVSAGIVIQIVAAAIIAWLIGQGTAQENSSYLLANIIRVIGVVTATVLAWILSPEQKIAEIAVAVGSVLLLPLVVSLLFWGIDIRDSAIGLCISLGVFVGCLWLLKRQTKGKQWRFSKNRYR